MLINYSISFQALDQFALSFNIDQNDTGSKIRQSMIATAKEIIKIYGVTLVKSHKVSPLDICNLPSLRTNNIQLAKITHASGRTIQRHIKRLLSCGILIEKIWHGSNSSYELFINPKILWINGIGVVNKAQKDLIKLQSFTTENQDLNSVKTTKCPHSYTNKKTNKRNNRIIAVDKLQKNWDLNSKLNTDATIKNTDKETDKSKERSSHLLTTLEDTKKAPKKNTEKTRRKNLMFKKARRKDAWRENFENEGKPVEINQTGAPKIEVSTMKTGDNYLTQNTRHAFLSNYVEELWGLAKDYLYKDVWLNTRQCDIAKTLLYQWYEPVSNEKLEYVHTVYKSRIFIARDYVARDPINRFIKLPSVYFDPKSKGGFSGTKSWYEAEIKQKEVDKLKKIVRQEIRKFRNNEKKDTAIARPRLMVFRECEQRISKFGVPHLLSQFYSAVMHPTKNMKY